VPHKAKVEERDMHTTLAPLYQDSGHHCKAIKEDLSSPKEDRIRVWKVLRLSSFGSLVIEYCIIRGMGVLVNWAKLLPRDLKCPLPKV
jgi:hypothetical protein